MFSSGIRVGVPRRSFHLCSLINILDRFAWVSLFVSGVTGALCPSTCTATVDGSSFPCRYHDNDCKVNVTNLDSSRVVDINVAVINPYVGGLGDMMTMAEPSISMAMQDIENSDYLPGYRLNAYLVDSKCTVPDATTAAVAAMTTGPKKHIVFSDSCSAACQAVNDALRHFQVLQVGSGCVSVSLSDSARYPYFTRMAPSFRFNVLSIYELFKFFAYQRIGIVYGYRSINSLAKDLLLEMMANDNAAGTYSWTPLFNHRVEFIADAQAAIDLAASKDSRINMMALYELEGSMLLCQAFKKNVLAPEFNWFVASGWWNQNFITLTAGTAKVPCTVNELHRASYSLIASDRGPMLNTQDIHSLSRRTLADLYSEYTDECQGWANGKGSCNHQWAGYFYDGIWLIASILHTFLIDQNRSVAELATSQSLEALYQLSLQIDFMGQTGRVRQFNSVAPKTTPPSYGDRDGIVLLRQVTGPPESAFVQLAFRTEDGLDFKRDILWSSTDASKKMSCSGSTCNFATGWIPADRTSQCPAGRVWNLEDGCLSCSPGSFAALGMTECDLCAPGTISDQSGASACSPCGVGHFSQTTGSSICFGCPEGKYTDQLQSTACSNCPIGSYADTTGLSKCNACPAGRETVFEGASSQSMCVCPTGQRLVSGACVACEGLEICQGGRIVGYRPTNAAWITTLDVAGKQRSLSERMGKEFFLVALKIRQEKSKAQLEHDIETFTDSLNALTNGDASRGIIAAPDKDVAAALEATHILWTSLSSLMAQKVEPLMTTDVVDMTVVGEIEEGTTLLRLSSQAVVDALTTASATAGAQLNGLLVDIAGRQRTLIQVMCKEALGIALAVDVTHTMEKLKESTSLFEETQDGLVFGIPAVGIPELRQMCTMHQMREVNYYFRQVRPYLREIMNAPTNRESIQEAQKVASDLASLTDPFFNAMLAAVVLFRNDTGACNPLDNITESEWLVLTSGIANARVGLTEAMRHYMQVAIGLAIQDSKVELSVLVSGQSQLLSDLVQGQKLENMPAPPTQQMLEKFISVTNAWKSFSVGLEEAVRATTIPQVDISLQIILMDSLLADLNAAMDLQVQAGATAGSTVQMGLLDLTHRQEYLFHYIPTKAYEVLFGAAQEEEVNTTIASFRLLHRELIMGAPATEQRMELQRMTDLCIIRGLAEVMKHYYEVEQASFQIVNNESEAEAVNTINQESPAGITAMALSSSAIYRYYQGETESCANVTFTRGDWELVMLEVTYLAGLVEDALSAIILTQNIDAALSSLRDSMDRLVMGAPNPRLPVQPTQEFFLRIIDQLQPLVVTFLGDATTASYKTVQEQGASIIAQAKSLLVSYTNKALELDPAWPGIRVRVAMWQTVLAKKVYKEALAERFDVVSALSVAEMDFEQMHQQLKDGGDGVAAMVKEREDLLGQWERIGAAWQTFKTSKELNDLTKLLAELEGSLPLFAIQDVESAPSVPYGFYIAYGVLGTLLLICICAAFIVAKNSMKNTQQGGSNAAV